MDTTYSFVSSLLLQLEQTVNPKNIEAHNSKYCFVIILWFIFYCYKNQVNFKISLYKNLKNPAELNYFCKNTYFEFRFSISLIIESCILFGKRFNKTKPSVLCIE